MGQEIERKYLVRNLEWRDQVQKRSHFTQGYLASGPNNTVRLRIADDGAWITIKGPRRKLTALEFEYPIPIQDAHAMLPLCPSPPLSKTRHFLNYQGHEWIIDVFEGRLKGLVLGEIELNSEDEQFSLPPWLGEDVSDDQRYRNSALAADSEAKIHNGRLV